MKAVIQRVTHADVTIDGDKVGSIGGGFLIFLGVVASDDEGCAARLWDKILKLRIFADENGKTNLALHDVDGGVLIVSQFTLAADCRRGNRPSFTGAGSPEDARRLYEDFISLARRDIADVQTGRFGADMAVSLTNDGPFTIILDTDLL